MASARIQVPARARRGEVIELRAIVSHVMETGFRNDNVGRRIPRHIVETFECTFNGERVFAARFFPAISANPYVSFFVVAGESGEFVFTWKDDRGEVTVERARLEVS